MCLWYTFIAYLANTCSFYDVHIRKITFACMFQFQNWWMDSNEIWHKYHATVGQPKILLFISYLTSCYQNGWCMGSWGVKVTPALLPRSSNHTNCYNQCYSLYCYHINYGYLEQLSSLRMLRIKHAWGNSVSSGMKFTSSSCQVQWITNCEETHYMKHMWKDKALVWILSCLFAQKELREEVYKLSRNLGATSNF